MRWKAGDAAHPTQKSRKILDWQAGYGKKPGIFTHRPEFPAAGSALASDGLPMKNNLLWFA